ncbi:MAG: tetratricopeptide repeat protein [Bacteroidetes bacterium]|nr:tetratricopeptide repeat protein [Bacteroidota bacterium]
MKEKDLLQQTDRNIILEAALLRIEQVLGLRYKQHQWSDLLRLLKPAASELGFKDVPSCVAWIARDELDDDAVRVLGKHLTIGESYFFREIIVFSLLKEHVFPEIIAQKEKSGARSIRIWSAGCSTGEEVYSVAILLDSLLQDRSDWMISVLGTDINPAAIERAREGRYREWSFRDIPAGIIQSNFEGADDGKLEVAERIREMTDFQFLNLAGSHTLYPGGFDLILCRNVLMYFTRPKIQHIVQGFRRSVIDRGWLIPSLTETTLINNPGFEGVRFGEATLFRKQGRISHILSLRKTTQEEKDDADPPAPSAPSIPTQAPTASSSAFTAPSYRPQEADTLPLRKSTGTALAELTVDVLPQTARVPGVEPHKRDMLLREAQGYADHGDLSAAHNIVQEVVETDKMNPQVRFIFATILREMGETSLAMQEFHRALYLDHGFIPAHFALGSLYRHLGETQRARRHFRNALQLLEACRDKDATVESAEISVRRMIEIVKTMLREL